MVNTPLTYSTYLSLKSKMTADVKYDLVHDWDEEECNSDQSMDSDDSNFDMYEDVREELDEEERIEQEMFANDPWLKAAVERIRLGCGDDYDEYEEDSYDDDDEDDYDSDEGEVGE